MISIAVLRAAGLSADQIVRVLETAEAEKIAHRREKNRIYKQNQRARQQNRADSADIADINKKPEQNQRPCQHVSDDLLTSPHIDIEDNLSSSSTQSKKKERKKVSISLPQNWSPSDAGMALAKKQGFGEEKIKLELHRFKDHATAHNKRYADWDAAWRNWVTSPYQQTGNGNAKRNGLMEALDRAIDRAGGGEVGGGNTLRDITPRRSDPSQASLALVAARKPS